MPDNSPSNQSAARVTAQDLDKLLNGLTIDCLRGCRESLENKSHKSSKKRTPENAKRFYCLPHSVCSILNSSSEWLPTLTKYHGYAASRHWQRTSSFFSSKYNQFASLKCFYWFLFQWQGYLGVPKQITAAAGSAFALDLGYASSIPPIYWIWKKGKEADRLDALNTREGIMQEYAKDRTQFLIDCVDHNVCPSHYAQAAGLSSRLTPDIKPTYGALKLIHAHTDTVGLSAEPADLLRTLFEVALANPTDPTPVLKLIPESISLFRLLEVDISSNILPFFPLLCWISSRGDRHLNASFLAYLDALPSRKALLKWFIDVWCSCHPAHLLLIDISFIEEYSSLPDPKCSDGPVEIVANWDGLGLSKNAEMTLSALQNAGIEVIRSHPQNGYLDPIGCHDSPSRIIYHVNADDCVHLIIDKLALRPCLRSRAKMLGFFLWESEQLPLAHELGCELIDTILIPSRFLLTSYNRYRDKTILVGKSVELPDQSNTEIPREVRNMSTFRVMFLLVFDSGSGVERKNPYPAVKTFEELFGERSDVCLVVKASKPPDNHWGDPFGQFERIKRISQQYENIFFIERRLSDEEIFGLVYAADIIVSCHRAEGFGYLMSYAILARKQLVATGYSGISEEIDSLGLPWLPLNYVLRPPLGGKFFQEMDSALWAEIFFSDLRHRMLEAFNRVPSWRDTVIQNEQKFNVFERYYSLARYSSCLALILDPSSTSCLHTKDATEMPKQSPPT